MNAFIILSALVAVCAASGVANYGDNSYTSGQGYVENDATGNTVDLMGYDQNYDGLPDKADTNRDGRPDRGYGYGHGFGHGFGHGHVYGGYGYRHGRYGYDRHGLTVPVMGKDQNNDGVADFKDRNRDGKEDNVHYGYGHQAGYGYNAGYGYGGYPAAGYGYGGARVH